MSVGIVGLGIMGSAYAKNLLAAGVTVMGADPLDDARARLEALGGKAYETAGPWLADCDLIILSLVSPTILHDVCRELTSCLRGGQIVLETGTFALADKEIARDILAAANVTLMDCTVSGTGVQAEARDIVMMASGPSDALARARPYLAHFTKKVIDAGPFGGGTKLKFVANHAVALHNVAAAETLNYATAMGLDADVVYDLLSTGAGQSKMSDLRMPLMISGDYDPPTASLKMFQKDLSVIGADISRLGIPTPLFDACVALYEKANAQLPETYDTASVYEVYAVESGREASDRKTKNADEQ